jgi:hypothetical protein
MSDAGYGAIGWRYLVRNQNPRHYVPEDLVHRPPSEFFSCTMSP